MGHHELLEVPVIKTGDRVNYPSLQTEEITQATEIGKMVNRIYTTVKGVVNRNKVSQTLKIRHYREEYYLIREVKIKSQQLMFQFPTIVEKHTGTKVQPETMGNILRGNNNNYSGQKQIICKLEEQA